MFALTGQGESGDFDLISNRIQFTSTRGLLGEEYLYGSVTALALFPTGERHDDGVP